MAGELQYLGCGAVPNRFTAVRAENAGNLHIISAFGRADGRGCETLLRLLPNQEKL